MAYSRFFCRDVAVQRLNFGEETDQSQDVAVQRLNFGEETDQSQDVAVQRLYGKFGINHIE